MCTHWFNMYPKSPTIVEIIFNVSYRQLFFFTLCWFIDRASLYVVHITAHSGFGCESIKSDIDVTAMLLEGQSLLIEDNTWLILQHGMLCFAFNVNVHGGVKLNLVY